MRNVCVNVNAGVCRGQKKTWDLLLLELWVVVNCLTWGLGTTLISHRSSSRS